MEHYGELRDTSTLLKGKYVKKLGSDLIALIRKLYDTGGVEILVKKQDGISTVCRSSSCISSPLYIPIHLTPKVFLYSYQYSRQYLPEIVLVSEDEDSMNEFIEQCIEHKMAKKYQYFADNILLGYKVIGTTTFDLQKLKKQKIDPSDYDMLTSKQTGTLELLKRTVNSRVSNLSMNLLLYGPPGTGKTHYARLVALALKKEIIYVSSMTSPLINYLINTLKHRDCIVVLDDVDTFTMTRNRTQQSEVYNDAKPISLAELNGFLDISSVSGFPVMFTTNYVKRLDSALTRDGRVLERLEFTYLKEDQIRRILTKYFDEKTIKKVIGKVCMEHCVISVLENWAKRLHIFGKEPDDGDINQLIQNIHENEGAIEKKSDMYM
jgi:hypothetical protein